MYHAQLTDSEIEDLLKIVYQNIYSIELKIKQNVKTFHANERKRSYFSWLRNFLTRDPNSSLLEEIRKQEKELSIQEDLCERLENPSSYERVLSYEEYMTIKSSNQTFLD